MNKSGVSHSILFLLLLLVVLVVLSSCGSEKVICPSCNKQVDKLIRNTDAAGEIHEWCTDCWNDYWSIIDPQPENKNTEPLSTPVQNEEMAIDLDTLEKEKQDKAAAFETEFGIYQEDGRYGVKIGDSQITDAIWQYIEGFHYNDRNCYLVTLNDKTGLMDDSGNLIMEPVWTEVYAVSQNDDGKIVYNAKVKEMTSYTDQGFIVLRGQLYRIDSGKTIQIPDKGRVIYVRNNMLVMRQEIGGSSGKKAKIIIYDLQKQETVDSMYSYAYRHMAIAQVKIEEVGEWGFFVGTNNRDDYDKDPYWYYGFYLYDGSLIIKSGIMKPVIFPEYKIVVSRYFERGNGLRKYFRLYHLNNGQEITDASFMANGDTDQDTNLPVIYDVDGQHVMTAMTSPEVEDEYFVIINLDLRQVIPLPEGIKMVEPFSDGLAAVQNQEGKWGYVNVDGQFIFECQFDEGRPFENGTTTTILNYKKIILNKDGTIAD